MSGMRLIVAGAGGRMGRTLIQAIAASKDATLAGAVDAPGSAAVGRDAGELAGLGRNGVTVGADVAPLLASADGLLDFTIPAATLAYAELAARHGGVHIIGTTGLTGENEKLIAEAAKRAVIVKSGNMSMGVNLLVALTKQVAKTLDEDFDIEIVEMHHNKKVDAPSGTALMLGQAAADGRDVDLKQRSERWPRWPHRRAPVGRHRLCVAARRHRGGRPFGDLRRTGRAHRTGAQGRGPHDLRARRRARGALGPRSEARALFDDGRAGAGLSAPRSRCVPLPLVGRG